MKNFMVLSLLLLWGTSCSNEGKVLQMEKWSDVVSGKKADLTDGKLIVSENQKYLYDGTGSANGFANFEWNAKILTTPDAYATIGFHTDKSGKGYEVVLHNGAIDGTKKTGSLDAVRNLYRSLAEDGDILSISRKSVSADENTLFVERNSIETKGEWFPVQIAVKGKNIAIKVNGVEVVNYTEPENPYRMEAYKNRLLGSGTFSVATEKGIMVLDSITVVPLGVDAVNPDALTAIDEQNDNIIKLQQQNFPVIDYHVHLKGDLTKEMAHAMSMNYGINYGVAPNAGEGGVGRMLANDKEVYEYFEEVKPLPFLCGVQGEGRKWTRDFSQEALGVFDYLFTDAMTIIDHKGRNSRIYRAEEVHYDGVTKEQYMDHLVNQTVKILTNEPADIFANPTFLPDDMNADYDKYWTDKRVERVLDVLQKYNIALEINPRYCIPSMNIIRKAKERGIKFTFGTNNVDSNFGKLEYCIEAIEKCGITADDIWFPSMSVRRERPVVIYNKFE